MSIKSKQVIVARKDLNVRKGKLMAQASHASLKAILDQMQVKYADVADGIEMVEMSMSFLSKSAMDDWLNGLFTKICVSVNSEDELVAIYEQAKALGLPCSLIVDAGLTEFNGVPTKTCVAVGPAWEDAVNQVTAGLPLL